MRTALLLSLLAVLSVPASGCRSAMYSTLESFGVEKRDLLVRRVGAARDAQESAKEQFASALDQFRSVVEVDAGELERTYDRLNREYSRSEDRAGAVSARIEAVERVADDLFEEWEEELGQYSRPELRRDSKRLLSETRQRYTALITAMRRAESSMNPVLAIFQDQVLTLKHNLNAQAIGRLRTELASIEKQTAALIRDMERAIAEANEFIQSMSAREV
jgi:septal ring factor EnvC (AmiA/AmiB activator)